MPHLTTHAVTLVAGYITAETVKRFLAGFGFLVIGFLFLLVVAYPVAKVSGVMEDEGGL